MPIYEYQCKACGFEFETIQKVSEEALKDCPECGELELKKLISKAAFRLKGGGWYETDFKSGNKKNVVGSDAKADAGTGTDSKTEAKSESKSESMNKKNESAKSESAKSASSGGGSTSESSPG